MSKEAGFIQMSILGFVVLVLAVVFLVGFLASKVQVAGVDVAIPGLTENTTASIFDYVFSSLGDWLDSLLPW